MDTNMFTRRSDGSVVPVTLPADAVSYIAG